MNVKFYKHYLVLKTAVKRLNCSKEWGGGDFLYFILQNSLKVLTYSF